MYNTEQRITDEINRAVAAENALNSSIDTEVQRAVAEETEIVSLLGQETLRAKAAESALDIRIDTISGDTSDIKTEITSLTNNLAAEVTRATNAEQTLTNNLAAEVTRATNAEQTLTNNLAAEVTRATNAEQTLTNNLAAEITRATNAEQTLTNNLAAEITRAKAAEEALRNIGDWVNLFNNNTPEVIDVDLGTINVNDSTTNATFYLPTMEIGKTYRFTATLHPIVNLDSGTIDTKVYTSNLPADATAVYTDIYNYTTNEVEGTTSISPINITYPLNITKHTGSYAVLSLNVLKYGSNDIIIIRDAVCIRIK